MGAGSSRQLGKFKLAAGIVNGNGNPAGLVTQHLPADDIGRHLQAMDFDVCASRANTAMTINKEVVWRDNLYYLGVVVFLLVALALPFFSVPVENPEHNTQYWGMMVALLFIALYVIYVFLLHHSYKASLKAFHTALPYMDVG